MGTFYVTERNRKRRTLIFKIKLYSAVVLLLLLLGGFFYFVAYSRVLKVTSVQITQINKTPENMGQGDQSVFEQGLFEDLKNFYASRSKLTAFLGTQNILAWSDALPDSKVFKAKYSDIKNIEIKKSLVRRSLGIEYERRNRKGVWCFLQSQTNADSPRSQSGQAQTNAEGFDSASSSPRSSASSPRESACWWFDESGVVFAPAPNAEGNLLFRVDDYTGRTLAPGDAVLEERFIPNLFKVFAFLNQFDFQVRSLRLDNLALQEISTDALNGSMPKIYFSLRFDPSPDLQPLKILAASSSLKNIQYIDLRVENRIYYK